MSAFAGHIIYAAQGDAIDIARVYSEADDASGELVHDHENAVAREQNGLAAKQIDTPQAVFHVTDESEPRGSATTTSCWAIVLDVLVDVETEGLGDNKSDSQAAESGIVLLELDDRPDELLRWSFGTGLALPA